MKEKPSPETEKYSTIHKRFEFSEKDLQKFYGKKIPIPVDLVSSVKRVKLSKYIEPFRSGKILRERFGTDFSRRMPELWEIQFEDFYTKVIKKHWNSFYGEPKKGFKIALRRACAAGVMYRCGFRPLNSLKLVEERKKKIEKNRIKQEKEKEEAEKQRFLMYIRSENIARVALKFKQLPKEEKDRIEMDFSLAKGHVGAQDNFGLFLVDLAEKGILDLKEVNLVTLENMEEEKPFLIFS
jgi:hypothetical protein